MNGTERLYQYCTSLDSEAPLERPNPPSPWPPEAAISLDDGQLRYRAKLPLSLKSLSLDIRGGEILGVVQTLRVVRRQDHDRWRRHLYGKSSSETLRSIS